jgi:flagellar motor switch protein FliG
VNAFEEIARYDPYDLARLFRDMELADVAEALAGTSEEFREQCFAAIRINAERRAERLHAEASERDPAYVRVRVDAVLEQARERIEDLRWLVSQSETAPAEVEQAQQRVLALARKLQAEREIALVLT